LWLATKTSLWRQRVYSEGAVSHNLNGVADMKYLIVFLLACVIASPAVAEPTLVGPTTLDRSHQFLMPSEAVGDTFRVDVIVPMGYAASEETYPVVIVTDSNYLLTSAAATQLAQATGDLTKVIIVAIGYDVPSIAETAQIRVRDLTPTCSQERIDKRGHPAHLCGKADNFIAFIRDELKPFIKEQYRAADNTTLVGYSFGGVFALHALFADNDIADRYVIGSPSIDWDGSVLFDEEAQYAKDHETLPKRVYLSAGGLEGYATIPNLYLMYEKLKERKYPELEISLEVLDD